MRIDELRSTLDDRADTVLGQDDTAGRVRSVHGRIAQTRRRRQAAGVGATLAAAVVAVSAVVVPGLLHDAAPRPADTETPARLAGVPVPGHRTVEGFDYAYVRGVETSERTLRLVLPASDTQRSLAWASNATSDAEAFVSVKVDGEEVSRSRAGGLDAGQVLYPGDKHTVVLTIDDPAPDNRLGLAVYERTDTLPDGVGNGTATFRRQVAEDRLVDARISDPGQRELSFDVVVPSTRLRFSDFCTGAGKGRATATTRINGHVTTGVPCDDEDVEDPGAGGSWFPDSTLEKWGIRPGATVHVTMRLTARMGGEQTVDAPGAVMGLGVYEVAPPAATVAGWDVARFTESDGSTWAYESSVESEPGARSLRLRLPAADRDRQVSVALGAFRDGSVELLVDGEQADSSENYTGAGGGSFGVATTLVAGEGHTLELRIVRGGGASPRMGLVVASRKR